MPHERDEAIRRLSSSIRSGVRATSMPPLCVKTPISLYCVTLSTVSAVISLRVVGQEDEVGGVTGRPAGVRERALLEQDDVAPAELGEVVGHAVADDAGADDDDIRPRRERAHATSSTLVAVTCPRRIPVIGAARGTVT